MASFDYRLNPLYAIKECSSCGALYTTDYCCSKGGLVDKIICDLNKTPDSSQRCGNPVDGLYCRGCALLRKKFKEDLFTYCVENGIFQDLQDTSESSNDNTNVVNAPQEPFVVKQDPGVNSSQSPPLIDHHCCYECGDSLDDIFCQRCTCKSCGKGAHYGYNCPPQIPIISNPEPCYNQNLNEILQNLQSLQQQCLFGTCQQCGCNEYDGKEEEKRIAEDQAAKDRYWKILICYDDDDDEESSIPLKDINISGLPPCVAVTPVLLTEEPVISLIMEDEHLDTIAATESDEVIKSSVEELIPIPSESKGIPDKMCDVPFCDNPSPLEAFKEHYEIVVNSNNDSTSSDDDSPYGEDIDYVDAPPPDSKLVSLEVVEIVIPKVGGIDIDILQTIKDDILHEKLLNVNLLIAKIEALKDNRTPSFNFLTNSGSTTTRSDYSLQDYEAFYLDDDHVEENSSGSTTTHADFSQYDSSIFDLSINPFPPADRSDFYHEEFAGEFAHIISPSEYDHFYFKIKPELGNFTMDVVEDILDNPTRKPRVHVPNVLPTHPTLHLDSDFTIFSDSLRSVLVVSFPSETRNKIFDPGIFIRVQSKIFLSRDAFSILFIRDPFFPVIDTLIPFSSENEDKVVNTSILAAGEEQSPHLSSHRGLKDLNESPMMIHGENTLNLGVRHLHFYPL
ncbi:hypothetical protein Tco_0307571 [Tanacetum coccineum]